MIKRIISLLFLFTAPTIGCFAMQSGYGFQKTPAEYHSPFIYPPPLHHQSLPASKSWTPLSAQTVKSNPSTSSTDESTVVEPSSRISNFDAQFALSEIWSSHDTTQNYALEVLMTLAKKRPTDKRIYLEIGKILDNQQKYGDALRFLYFVLNPHGDAYDGLNLITSIQTPQLKPIDPLSIKLPPSTKPSSVVPAKYSISDMEAELALAQIWSQNIPTQEQALQLLARLLKKNPEDPSLYLQIGKVLDKEKKYTEALAFINYAMLRYPDAEEGKKLAALIPLLDEQQFQALLKRKPKETILKTVVAPESQISDFEAQVALGQAWSHDDNKLNDALNLFNELLKQHPQDKRLNFDIAKVLVQQKKDREALKYINLILQPPPGKAPSKQSVTIAPKIYEKTIVPNDAQINDYYARLALAQLFSRKEETYDAALAQYSILKMLKPQDPLVYLGISKIWILQKKYEEGRNALCYALSLNSGDPLTIAEAADVEALYGHARQSRCLYQLAFAMSPDPSTLMIRYADTIQTWGEFYQSEKIYREYLNRHPDSMNVWMKLAHNLWSAKRYPEAEGIYYRLLAACPCDSKVLLALARLKLLEDDYCEALELVDELLCQNPCNQDYIQLKGEILFQMGRYCDAIEVYKKLIYSKKYGLHALITIGRSYLKLHEDCTAEYYFRLAAASYPESVEAEFYAAGFEATVSMEYVEYILRSTSSPQRLQEWGQVYEDNKFVHIATLLYDASVKADPDYLPARFSLADIYASEREYGPAICIYEQLNQEFPNSAKIMIRLARVLSWAQDYCASMAMYDKMIFLNPSDSLPRIEMGRVAFWANLITISMNSFQAIYRTPVDKEFYMALLQICDINQPDYWCALNELRAYIQCGSVYQGYEMFVRKYEDFKKYLWPWQQSILDSIIAAYFCDFRTQKYAYLERLAICQFWEKEYLASICTFKELIGFTPWNEEALFTLAQAYCNAGLCDCAANTYCQLLHISPLHKLAITALSNQRLRNRVSLADNYYYWKEQGRQGLNDVAKNRDSLVLEIPFGCTNHLRLIESLWYERALNNQQNIRSNEVAIEGDTIYNKHISAKAGFAFKNYRSHEFKSRLTGFAHVIYQFCDGLQLDFGYDKTNQLYNLFGYQQGTQADTWSIAATKDMNHCWNLSGWYKHYIYNDSNDMDEVQLMSTYAFTEDPKIFKLSVWGQYRNTKHADIFVFAPNTTTLINIIHPYWTPQNYFLGAITFEFFRDYAPIVFCGNLLQYADIKFTVKTDTESDPGFQINGEVKYEFKSAWSLTLTGLIHRSRQWNAEGFWGILQYRF